MKPNGQNDKNFLKYTGTWLTSMCACLPCAYLWRQIWFFPVAWSGKNLWMFLHSLVHSFTEKKKKKKEKLEVIMGHISCKVWPMPHTSLHLDKSQVYWDQICFTNGSVLIWSEASLVQEAKHFHSSNTSNACVNLKERPWWETGM